MRLSNEHMRNFTSNKTKSRRLNLFLDNKERERCSSSETSRLYFMRVAMVSMNDNGNGLFEFGVLCSLQGYLWGFKSAQLLLGVLNMKTAGIVVSWVH